jgi:DNA uptake protein ComE-like DNA-binding protein
MSKPKLFQCTKTSKIVEMLSTIDDDSAMVKDGMGNVNYASLHHLVPYEKGKGRLAKVTSPVLSVDTEEEIPANNIPTEDTRLNLNVATAEQIAKRLPGVGYTTAKRIIELRLSLSGERFNNLKQLENIPRVNWDQLIEEDLIFIS